MYDFNDKAKISLSLCLFGFWVFKLIYIYNKTRTKQADNKKKKNRPVWEVISDIPPFFIVIYVRGVGGGFQYVCSLVAATQPHAFSGGQEDICRSDVYHKYNHVLGTLKSVGGGKIFN